MQTETVMCRYCAERGYIEDTDTLDRRPCPACGGKGKWVRPVVDITEIVPGSALGKIAGRIYNEAFDRDAGGY